MKKYNLINCRPTDFVPDMPEEKRRASTYKANHFEAFTQTPIEYDKRRVFSWDTVKDFYIS
ncbi:hypothetical protein SAMN05421677_11770 [Halobacillus aidingensis]|uniref:Uncharacterized protein n=1 Tax=Halobacillus aidingensis TaxID=240303 RepID=A0A1H0S9K6_HALAD|nr:hypothetical protein SAMN05421677_11770 [Halobacillus aidingensis]